MRKLLPVALAAALVLPVSAVSAQPTPELDRVENPGLGIRLLEAPEHLKDDPRAQVYVIDRVDAGTSFDRRIEVSNRTGADQAVDVYVGAADINSDGAFTVGDADAANELTGWMELDTNQLTLDDRETAEVTLTIDVPEDAEDGERYAVVWAQIASGSPDEGGAIVVNRVGIRTYLAVGDENALLPDFAITSVTPQRNDDGVAELVVSFDNTGGRAVDVSGEVELSEGPGGVRAGPFNSDPVTVAPGGQGASVFTLTAGLPNGPWQAEITLRSGLLERTYSSAITFPDTGVGDAIATDESRPAWLWVSIALLTLAIILAAVVAWRKTRSE
ncbi:hypothetical protein IEU95_09480 [Hoyosella rhizosphaerae]|uniref:DUF916 domain-containing protein n=1 Tax=Hoyosella rhizosphaerae TaxID=1755582 RepID=A0A916TZR4_9ACTN|nr:hypothetical protein [Hoyosella rhizosphaerae]MBN4927062.1 hypothetical protein [Hoyosella rhizosphaerae]GGC54342.1 hypothetical protein GCM10011410_03380 [Hoyosella rhizosphaerae]